MLPFAYFSENTRPLALLFKPLECAVERFIFFYSYFGHCLPSLTKGIDL